MTRPLPYSSNRKETFNGLAPLVVIVFFGFLAVAASLAALSLQLHDHLGLAPTVVGLIIGLQSITTVLTRHQAGTLSDHKGPKHAVLIGLPLTMLSGIFYLLSTIAGLGPNGALALIVLGRVLMGLGESLFITGAMSWGLARLGPAHTAKVMSWQGVAMYSAIGFGAPLGLAVQHVAGFSGVALVTIASPLVACAVAWRLRTEPGRVTERVPFYRVLGLIWRPGLIIMLATTPFAALAAFLALDYTAHGWAGAEAALAGFGGLYVLVRLLFSHLPDRFGGIRVATVSLTIETFGQALLWLAPGPLTAFLGACLTGIGFSLVFPAMGVEAMRRVAPAQRGRAVGNFIAFFDVALGLTAPLVGLAVGHFGFASAFFIGTAAALLAVVLVSRLQRY